MILAILLAGIAGACPAGWACLDTVPMFKAYGDITMPRDTANAISGTWSVTFHTKRHGSVDLDDLIDRIDSVLDGKRRRK